MFCPKLDNESGLVMIVVLVATLLGTLLASSYVSTLIYESRHSVWQKHRAQSLFLSEAGVEKALYYLNNTDDLDNPWVDEYGEMLDAPLYASGELAGGSYSIELYGQADVPWLPADAYLIKSLATIPRSYSQDVERRVSCVASKLGAIPIPAALSILDDTDPEIELDKFNSSQWTINGTDMDDRRVERTAGNA